MQFKNYKIIFLVIIDTGKGLGGNFLPKMTKDSCRKNIFREINKNHNLSKNNESDRFSLRFLLKDPKTFLKIFKNTMISGATMAKVCYCF